MRNCLCTSASTNYTGRQSIKLVHYGVAAALTKMQICYFFKTHVRSQIEWCYGAIFHAAQSKLERLDTVQSSFLRHMEINGRQAYLELNLAPLQLRREICMLGVLYKICNGTAHTYFDYLFPKAPTDAKHGFGSRATRRRHGMQLVDL